MDDGETDNGRTESQRILDETGFLSWLGIALESTEPGRAVLSLPHRDRLANADTDVIHGGVVATLIDNAGATALRTVLPSPENAAYATADLNVSYLRPATGDLRVEAEVRRAGSSMAVIQVDVDTETVDGEWTTVAIGRASYFVIDDGQ